MGTIACSTDWVYADFKKADQKYSKSRNIKTISFYFKVTVIYSWDAKLNFHQSLLLLLKTFVLLNIFVETVRQ